MELFRHQQEALNSYLKLFRRMWAEQMRTGIFHAVGCALLMEMGCGKTITSIAIAKYLKVQRVLRRMLIVAPLSILPVWEEELTKFVKLKNYSRGILNAYAFKKKYVELTSTRNLL